MQREKENFFQSSKSRRHVIIKSMQNNLKSGKTTARPSHIHHNNEGKLFSGRACCYFCGCCYYY